MAHSAKAMGGGQVALTLVRSFCAPAVLCVAHCSRIDSKARGSIGVYELRACIPGVNDEKLQEVLQELDEKAAVLTGGTLHDGSEAVRSRLLAKRAPVRLSGGAKLSRWAADPRRSTDVRRVLCAGGCV